MFGIERSIDRLQQLEIDFKNLRQDPLNVSLAEKTCLDAWHLVDWVYDEKKSIEPTLTKEQFRIKIYEECPEMKILHDLANSFKHKRLSSKKVNITKTENHKGDFNNDFSKDFNVSRLEVYFNDGTKIDVDDLVEISLIYWNSVITNSNR